ncbi:glycosyltransferase family 4 protein [Natrinema sp. DC36]|uniref:glycosyltransferase family 4 protein n=1 Tax=Natrinema sp. DC36 TaxID=2878680 RepID=UPI001CEFF8F7|nr:glycosyltransferase family 4 protein [Natrinema sp. DC36]
MSIAAVFSQNSSGEEEVHPVHREWMSSVADSIIHLEYSSLPSPLNKTFCNGLSQLRVGTLPESDVYLLEKPKHLYFLPKLKRKAPNSTIIYLHATCRFLGAKQYPRMAWGRKWPIGVVERTADGKMLRELLRRYVDGVITVSKLLENQILDFAEIPTRVVHPFVPKERANEFAQIEHSNQGRWITVLAENRPRKGVELVVEAWKDIVADFEQYELHIAGRGQNSRFQDCERVLVHGFVESLPDFFTSSDLHIHPAHCDPFPVSTIEAMMAGVPTIVSKYTGTRKLTSDVSREQVVDTTKESVRSAMKRNLKRPESDLRSIREESRRIAMDYQEGTEETNFVGRFNSLLSQVN